MNNTDQTSGSILSIPQNYNVLFWRVNVIYRSNAYFLKRMLSFGIGEESLFFIRYKKVDLLGVSDIPLHFVPQRVTLNLRTSRGSSCQLTGGLLLGLYCHPVDMM